MAGLVDSLFGGGGSSTTIVNTPGPMSEEEKELIKLQTDLSRKQLENIDLLQPFQKELLDLSLANLRRQQAESTARDAAISPDQRAAAEKADFERAQRLGPIQDELLQRQLEEIRRGGGASPEQIQRIKEAADAGIAAGTSDIDASTQRGIGLISDELANSRGLRLSDSPIKGEAALLAREGEIQKGSLVKNLRAGEATARLNYPLAAQQLSSGINLSTQNVAEAARSFQSELRQRAYQNRLALTGQTASTGIGLASIGDPSRTIAGLQSLRGSTQTQNSSGGGMDLGGVGSILSGIAAIGSWSDRRLKTEIVKVGDDPRGFGIYEYTLFGERQRGVMADEVEKVIPAAVMTMPNGLQKVDYRMLR